jgi:hypothetical protein
LLQKQSTAATQLIIVLTDDQWHGFADETTRQQWQALGDFWRPTVDKLRAEGLAIPSLWLINVCRSGATPASNFTLDPLQTPRGLALTGQHIPFRSAVILDGFSVPSRPRRLYYKIDGQIAGEVPLSASPSASQGRIAVAFTHSFATSGSRVVSLKLEADASNDCLPGDNEQHVVVEVVDDLPLLLVDGDAQLSPESSTYFLQRALARPLSHGKSALQRTIPSVALSQRELFGKIPPAVVVLADVPRLSDDQAAALDRYLAEGGSVLVVLGERVAREATFYNDRLYRHGQGWLPARLLDVAQVPARPDMKTFAHPSLSLFAQDPQEGLARATFPRWWKVACEAPAHSVVMGRWNTGDPLLLEKPYKKGHVMLCTAPLDRRWDSSLPSTWEYPVLVHELVHYLAGIRAEAHRLAPGAPLRFNPREGQADLPAELGLSTPEGSEERIRVTAWPWMYEDTGALGVYRVRLGTESAYFIRTPELHESDRRPRSTAEERALADLLPIAVHTEHAQADLALQQRRQDVWWLLLLSVIVLLCGEVWLTRRLLLTRSGMSSKPEAARP